MINAKPALQKKPKQTNQKNHQTTKKPPTQPQTSPLKGNILPPRRCFSSLMIQEGLQDEAHGRSSHAS